MPKRENLRRIDERIPINVTTETGDTAMGLGPATCSVSSTNAQTVLSHTHEITTCSDGSVYPAILASDALTGALVFPSGAEVTAFQFTADWGDFSTAAVGTLAVEGQMIANSAGAGNGTILINDPVARISGGGTYEVGLMRYLTTPLTSSSWNGDVKTSANNGTLDLSSVFSAPAGIKAILVQVNTAVSTVGDVFNMGPSVTYYSCLNLPVHAGETGADALAVVPCDANGDVYVKFTGTMEIDIRIYGYAI